VISAGPPGSSLSGITPPSITTPDDVAEAVAHDVRLRGCTVRRRERNWLELEVTGLAQRARGGAVMVVLAWPELWNDPTALAGHLVRARSGNYGMCLIGRDSELSRPEAEAAVHAMTHTDAADVAPLPVPVSALRLAATLRERADAIAMRQAGAAMELELERARHENQMLISVGRALSSERDLDRLLDIILREAREVTGADAGSVYVVEQPDAPVAERTLRFMVSHNDSRRIERAGFTMKVSSASIVGTAVISSDVVNIPDLYKLAAPGSGSNPWGFVHDRSFDDKYRYQTRSMLTVPMISARGHVIGVIQLINKRAKGVLSLDGPADFDLGVVPFDEVSVAYASALASQAGIALENAMLYDEVRTLFDGFVKASVTAIESRDPTTSGHSERVAQLTVGLAKVVDGIDDGEFAPVRFGRDDLTVIQYAGLLHDFGKVGVREHVLVKAKKLYEHQRELILERFRYIRRGLQVTSLEDELRRLRGQGGPPEAPGDLAARLAELDGMVNFILAANEPTVLEQGGFERIAEIASHAYVGDDGVARPYLLADEVSALQIRRGSLTDAERDEINSHVVHTYNFLKAIPWSRQLCGIPEIAGAHHERLDGTGYPARRRGGDIPIASRMMAIADIYDALTASDRPYKKAMPAQRALSIIESEVTKGMLDAALYKVFVDARVYEQVASAGVSGSMAAVVPRP
jgi:HD-GYP domain-containing protein (c-di-GMP phosphodiesterase class II)